MTKQDGRKHGEFMYFNPICFSQEAFGTLGNFEREGLYGPSLVNLDVGLLKSTRIRENMTLQFRGELFKTGDIYSPSHQTAAIGASAAPTCNPSTRKACPGTRGSHLSAK